jgi:sugar/nucleoside kinase (ribokinase family)
MCALFEGLPVPEAMRHGTANGWSVVQKIGPQAGLLTSADMRKVIKKFSRIQPRVEK